MREGEKVGEVVTRRHGQRLYALFVNMVGRSLLCSHRLRSREGGWMSQGLALTRWATLNVRSVSP